MDWNANFDRRTRFSKANLVGIGVVAAVILYIAAPIVAPKVIGPRGDLFGLVLEWIVVAALGAMFAVLPALVLLGWDQKWRYLAAPIVLVFAGISIYACVLTVLTGIDLVLPFQSRDVALARSYWVEPQGGRGAIPESGGWHLVSDSGKDYKMRPSAGASHLAPGKYQMKLSHFRHLVMTKRLITP